MLFPLDLNEDFVYEEGIAETSMFSLQPPDVMGAKFIAP
jgi:hypothetical protein